MNAPWNQTKVRLHPTRTAPRRGLAIFAALVALAAPANGQTPKRDVIDVPAIGDGLCVSNLFQSHMVLQRDKPIALWGWAAAGERVTVTIGDERRTARAGADRRWRVTLDARPASSTPVRITVEGGDATLTLDDVLIGDVWVLGGQSNMEFELAKVENGPLEIVSANHPRIRLLTVPYGVGPAMRESFPRLDEWSDWFGRSFRKGDWDACSPETVREFSAIGYVFARRVHMASGVPIGVIDASRGGTTVEAWTPRAALEAIEDATVRAALADWDSRVEQWDPEQDLARRVSQHRDWLARMEAEGRPIPEGRREAPTDLRPGPIADPNLPGNSFAAMIAPLRDLAVAGAIFHQGYNNALRGMPGVRLYAAVFPAMIREWRRAFGDPELPFCILSLCTAGEPQTRENYLEKMLDAGIHIRAVQYRTFLDLSGSGDKGVGFASTYDLRRPWYHPQLKIPAGERVARWALATRYGFGDALAWKPPRVLRTEPRDGALIVTFDAEVANPLEGAIEGFAIAGSDRRFQPADATYAEAGEDDRGQPRYDRTRLVLKSPLVAEPIHFRYAWGRNPLANLQLAGHKDVPVATQRSDDWDMGTVPLGVLAGEIDGAMTRAQRNRVLQALRAEDLRRRLEQAKALLSAHGEETADGR